MTIPGRSMVSERAFETSGHSGEPIIWMRTEQQLLDEVSLLARSVVGRVDRVVNFAPPEHLYGRLLGFMLPERFGIPVDQRWSLPLSVPELEQGTRVLLVCLPSTWILMRSLVPQLRELREAVAVHSAGPTVPATGQVVEAMQGSRFRLVELFGSTETGVIAHRTLAPNPEDPPLWHLFDDVSLIADTGAEQLLRISSPRLARRADMERSPSEITLEDVVRPVGDDRFARIGRSTGLIKINGRRFHLEHFESVLRRHYPHLDIACVPVPDDIRSEHYELYCTDDAPAVGTAELHARLTAAIPGVPVPRSTHRVQQIPRSATGKVRAGLLRARGATAPVGGAR